MGYGLVAAGGLEAAQQGLRQRLMDQLTQQHTQQQMSIQMREQALREQEAQRKAEEFKQTLAERQAVAKERSQGAAFGEAAKLAPNLPMNQNVSPQAGAVMDEGGLGGQLYAPPTQGENVNGTPFNPATANPRVNLGTQPQQVMGRLIGGLAADSPERRALEYEQATGKNAPAGVFDKKPTSPTGAEDDVRYEGIITNQKMGRPIAPQDMAWASAYEKRKTLGPAASSAAADARLGDQQLFTQQEAGRGALTRDVEKPYREATAAASALRDIVTSAQSGNKFAATQQSLEGTIATIRAAGLSRINQAEYGVSAGAGNVWDRIQGSIGKQVSGQPMAPELQQDLLKYADVLEKAAYKKYKEAHGSVTKRYKLTDEQPLPEPGPTTPNGPTEAPADRAARLRKAAGL